MNSDATQRVNGRLVVAGAVLLVVASGLFLRTDVDVAVSAFLVGVALAGVAAAVVWALRSRATTVRFR